MDYDSYMKAIIEHYRLVWGDSGKSLRWPLGPSDALCPSFRVMEFRARKRRRMWTYATCCMSEPTDQSAIELHLYSPEQRSDHVELLTAIAHFHRFGAKLDLGHTVYFGRPWMPGSSCDHGLISLPYLDGPALEVLELKGVIVRFLWLIPVTKREVEYKKAHGIEKLEQEFEKVHFNYLDPDRESVV